MNDEAQRTRVGETCRIHKWLAACGVASRRRAEELIRAGRVTLNGERVTRPGTLCDPERDVVAVDGQTVRPPQKCVYLAIHKPRGYVCTVRDPHAANRVVDLAPPELAGRVKPVGRLDKSSEGLLFLTDDGPLINRLTHPRFHVEKEYHVGVSGAFDNESAKALVSGVTLEDGPARAIEAAILRRDSSGAVVRIVLAEGRKRQVRRMIAALGHRVTFLRRVRIGPIQLGRLPKGRWRHLTKAEVRLLYQATETDQGRKGQDRRQGNE
ncbi:hypothetical protein AMJ85_01250 [candidate division BRC1 bacterium SM23_51]|nr:MAG: hypothetical protein AMJ85_01250 [candidate division BRC1 bacterium SM23_51]